MITAGSGQNRIMIDPVLRAARRQNALDRIAELLDDWGSPHPRTRAVAILEAVTDCGYRLPGADEVPLRGPGSTPQGRAAALAQIRSALGTRRHIPAPESAQERPTGVGGHTDTPSPNRSSHGGAQGVGR
jgi:hypothetical protein